ncbi:amino acid deaminase [Gulosibacter sediminis]|uniref:amino acid deaminase n=1 Tax=Gulosibacter sediminis TaxID=1729695 RepID=UPI003D1575BF
MMDRTEWLPRALADIGEDAAAGRFAQWGRSTVIDENTGGPVLDRKLFDHLHDAAGIEATYPVGNAGLLHVYGYWFSDEPTPYGYKRDRWLDGNLALALGLPAEAFHLDGPGTLLERVTAAIHPSLLAPPADARGTADVRLGSAKARVVLLGADEASNTALIYGIDGGDGFRLISAFPLTGDSRSVLADFVEHPRYRWNADDSSKTSPAVHLGVDL